MHDIALEPARTAVKARDMNAIERCAPDVDVVSNGAGHVTKSDGITERAHDGTRTDSVASGLIELRPFVSEGIEPSPKPGPGARPHHARDRAVVVPGFSRLVAREEAMPGNYESQRIHDANVDAVAGERALHHSTCG